MPAVPEMLEHIYRAAGNAALWDGVMGHMSRLVDADSGLMFSPGGEFLLQQQHAHNHDFGTAREYGDYYHLHDVWTHSDNARRIYRTGLVVPGTQLVTLQSLRKSMFYNDFLRRMGQESLLVTALFDDPTPSARVPPTILSFYRRPGRRGFGPGATARLQKIVPHLQHGLTLHHELMRAHTSSALHEAALDQVTAGVLLLEADHRIRFSNRSAEALMRQIPKRQDLLAALTQMSQLAQKGQFVGRQLPTPLGIVYAIACAPRARAIATAAAHTRGCVIWLLNPGSAHQTPLQLASQMFSLTPAEQKVLGLLQAGHAPKSIAAQLHIELTTVRSQLSNILHKTSTSRQQELLQLLAAFPSP